MRGVLGIGIEPVRARCKGNHAAEEEGEREQHAVDRVRDVVTVTKRAQGPSAYGGTAMLLPWAYSQSSNAHMHT